MSHDLLHILANSNKDIDNQKLMDYIAGQLSAKEKHEVEKWMAESAFNSEAVEGLQSVRNKKNIEALVEQLNKDLQKKLEQKKSRKAKRRLKEHLWVYIAIIIILLLITITWFIVHNLRATP